MPQTKNLSLIENTIPNVCWKIKKWTKSVLFFIH